MAFSPPRGTINLRKILVNRLMTLKPVKRRKTLAGELAMILLTQKIGRGQKINCAWNNLVTESQTKQSSVLCQQLWSIKHQ